MRQMSIENIEQLSLIVEKINRKQIFRFFPTNAIIHARISDHEIVFSGLYCKAIGLIKEQNIDLRVQLKRQFVFIEFFVFFLFSSTLWSENVTINGESEPSMWLRIGIFSIGIVILVILTLILISLKKDFENKVIDLIKRKNCC